MLCNSRSPMTNFFDKVCTCRPILPCKAKTYTGMLGWLSIEVIIDLCRLSYVYTLITLVRQLYVHIFLKLPVNENPPGYNSHIARLYATCEKYNLLDFVKYYVVFNSTKITKEKWKYIATRRVSEMYRNRWNISRCIYTSLQIFN